MTRKDYILIARIIKDNTTLFNNGFPLDTSIIKKDKLINDLCLVFKVDNSLFNEGKFRSACNDNSSNGKVD